MKHFNDTQFNHIIHELKSLCPKVYSTYVNEFGNMEKAMSVYAPEEIKAESLLWKSITELYPYPHYNVLAEVCYYLDRAVSIERIDMFTAQESNFFKKHYPKKSEADIEHLQSDYVANAFNLLLKDRKNELEALKKQKIAGRKDYIRAHSNNEPSNDDDSDDLPF